MSVRRPKIVVIDDSEIVLEVTRTALEGAGFEVVTHDRPAGCVALVLHEKPDLVLMDVQMPGLGGDTVVSVLAKALPRGETTVLLHSSLSAEILRTKAAIAGAQGFIQKSGDLFALVREVTRWLRRSHSAGSLSSGNMRAALAMSSDDSRSSGLRAAAAGAPVASASSPGMPAVSSKTSASSPSMPAISGRTSTSSPGMPAVSSPESAFEEGRRNSQTVRITPPSVLLVDDDMSVLSGYRRQLQAEEVSVEFALSGAQALRRMLSDSPPDVVICDMLLADVTGMEVFQRAVAAEPSYRQRFGVATGASTMPKVAAFLSTFGGPILYKPVHTEQLTSAVKACLSGARPYLRSSVRS